MMKTYLCIDDWCDRCKGRIYRIGRLLSEDEYEQNDFIRNNPRIIIIGKECCDCGKELTLVRQHTTCTDSEGQWWYQDVNTVDYKRNAAAYGERWFRCTACAIKRDPKYDWNAFPILGLESGQVKFCQCGREFIRWESVEISMVSSPSTLPPLDLFRKLPNDEEAKEVKLERAIDF